MTQKENIDCLLVTGMYRSGIAVIAGCLQLLGVHFGGIRQRLGPSDAEDAAGVNDVAVIHDILLRDLGCKWDMIGNLPDGWLDSTAAKNAKTRIGHFVDNQFASDSLWAVADPRLCRLMPLWETILNEKGLNPAYIVTIRHPWEVAQSLKEQSGMDVQHSHLLWLALNRTIFDFCRQRPYMATTNDQLIADPATVLNDIADQFGLTFPISFQRQYYRILEFVRPELRHHRLGRRYKNDHQQQAFTPFFWLYEQIRNYCAASRLLAHESSEADGKAILPACFSPVALPLIGDRESLQQQSNQYGNQLFQKYLSLIGQYEREDRELELQKIRWIISSTQKHETLFARLYLPTAGKKEFAEESFSDYLLIKGEWQEARFPISTPEYFSHKVLRFAPLNTRGTVFLSAMRLVNAATGKVCWEIKDPQNSNEIQLTDTLRLTDSETLSFLTYSDNAVIVLPLMPELPDCPIEFRAWLKVDTRQDMLVAAWKDSQKRKDRLKKKLDEALSQYESLRIELDESHRTLKTRLHENLAAAKRHADEDEERLAHLKIELDNKNTLEEMLRQETIDMRRKVDDCQDQNSSLKIELAKLQSHKRGAEDRLAATADELGQAQRRMAALEKKVKKSHDLLEKSLEESRKRADRLETEKKQLASEFKALSFTGLFKKRMESWKQAIYPTFRWKGRDTDARVASLFDRQWYLNTYASMIDDGVDPLKHYLIVGFKQGCNPNPLFHNDWYRESNPDVAESAMNPLVHYVNYGSSEKRFPNPLFDSEWYLAANPDVADSGAEPLMHFLTYGAIEGRNPHPLFFTQWYLNTYPDVAASGINPLVHYLDFGITAGNDPNPLFDTDWYLKTYPDVAQAGANPLAHYMAFGVQDSRDPNPLFDTGWYLNTYPDVAEAGVNPLAHYMAFGVQDGRDPNPLFDTDWYLETYPEVAESGTDPLEHYLQNGCLGDYNPNPFFDGSWYLKTYIDASDTRTNPLVHYFQIGSEAGYATAPSRRLNGSENYRSLAVNPLFQTPANEQTETLNLLFVLHNRLASNSGYQVYYHVERLISTGANCMIVVPEKEQNFDDFGGSVVCPVYGFKDIEKLGLTFNNGRGPDIVHAWTPREHVRKFCSQLKETYDFNTIIHLEDNEEYLTAKAVDKDWEALNSLTQEDLEDIIPDTCYHPVHGPRWIREADGLTMVVDTLEQFNYAKLPSLTIIPAVDERLFYPRPVNWELRQQLDIPDDHVVLAYTGNVHAANQQEVGELYKAVEMLNKKGCPTTLIRTGENHAKWPWNNPTLGRFVKEMGWVKRHELPDIFAAADIFIQPGKPGPFNSFRVPCKLPEYFSMGKPVILPSANIGVKVKHGKDAWVVKTADARRISAAVAMISGDRQLKKRLEIGCTEFYLEHILGQVSHVEMGDFYSKVALGA